MAIREIRKEGDAILRKECKDIKEMTERTAVLIDDMFDTMYEANGVGLAAPQVGILKKLFVIDCGVEECEPYVFINPEIIELSGEQTDNEGCLSIPDRWYEVTRPEKVTLKAFDRDGNEFTKTAEGIIARAFCHENDHLDGILFIDKVSPEDKQEMLENEEV